MTTKAFLYFYLYINTFLQSPQNLQKYQSAWKTQYQQPVWMPGLSAHLRVPALQPAWPTRERGPWVVQGGDGWQHVALTDVLSKVLVKETAGEERWQKSTEPGLLDSHIHCAPEVRSYCPQSTRNVFFCPRQPAYILCRCQSLPASWRCFWNNDVNCFVASLSFSFSLTLTQSLLLSPLAQAFPLPSPFSKEHLFKPVVWFHSHRYYLDYPSSF